MNKRQYKKLLKKKQKFAEAFRIAFIETMKEHPEIDLIPEERINNNNLEIGGFNERKFKITRVVL